MKKRYILTLVFSATICIHMNHLITCTTLYSNNNTTTAGIEMHSSETKWMYTTINGKTYRRLYDITNQCWIGEWELYT